MAKTASPKIETLTANQQMMLVANALQSRESFLRSALDAKKDINKECDYPERVELKEYLTMYEREGVGARVVEVWPQESWKVDPEIYEQEDSEETDFEKAWKRLQKAHNVLYELQLADILSGVGHYGGILIGVNDGKDLSEPVDGVTDESEVLEFGDGEELQLKGGSEKKLLFLRPLDESNCTIAEWESSPTSPRLGKPIFYNVKLTEVKAGSVGTTTSSPLDNTTRRVHWSRILHIADNCRTSPNIGTPRMRPVWNRLIDIRKVAGSSAEGFWKSAFPGLSFEVDPAIADKVQLDKKALRAEAEDYVNSLTRIIATQGVSVKTIAGQATDPSKQIEVALLLIAISLSIPLRVFMGSEQAQLASGQDKKTWNDRVARRQTTYLTPKVVRPFVLRMIAMGVLPPPKDICVDWPDLNMPSAQEKAELCSKQTEAMAKYVGGKVETLIPPMEWLTMVAGFTTEEAEAIVEAAEEYIAKLEAEGAFDTPEPVSFNEMGEPLDAEGNVIPTDDDGNPLPGQQPPGALPIGKKPMPTPKALPSSQPGRKTQPPVEE